MRKTMLVLTLFALVAVGADPAAAQDPCQPDCYVTTSSASEAPSSSATVAPVFLALAAVWRTKHSLAESRS